MRLTPRTRRARQPVARLVYVDPFDRICHGLGGFRLRNYRPERNVFLSLAVFYCVYPFIMEGACAGQRQTLGSSSREGEVFAYSSSAHPCNC